MFSLAIDTSNSYCSICLSKDGQIIDYICNTIANQQAKNLLVYMDNLLHTNNINYKDIKNISVAIGPGSFTGLRVGIAAISGIHIATQIPVLGISNFQIIAFDGKRKFAFEDRNIMVIINAMREQLYVQKFANDLQEISAPLLLDIDNINGFVSNDNCHLISDQNTFQLLKEKIKQLKSNDYNQLDARNIATATIFYQEHQLTKDLIPLYVRPPDAKPSCN